MKKHIVLADDHSMFRQGLAALLEREGFHVVGQATNGHEAIQLVQQHKPLLAILDFGMPLLNGIDAAREIHKRAPDTQVLLLTMFEDDAY
ncbi:MAG: response regulator transcription factor, partial [Pseudomonadota bacterium]|nr:response regulator transcription factor [Pseudomonadota bacterium]